MKIIKFLSVILMVCAFIIPKESNAQATSVMEEMYWEAWIPCANDGWGEYATGTLRLHSVDGKVFYQSQAAGGELVGEVTGTVYRPTGKTSDVSISFENGTPVYTYVNIYHFVGAGIQFYVHNVWHEIYVNGEWKVVVDKWETWCK